MRDKSVDLPALGSLDQVKASAMTFSSTVIYPTGSSAGCILLDPGEGLAWSTI